MGQHPRHLRGLGGRTRQHRRPRHAAADHTGAGNNLPEFGDTRDRSQASPNANAPQSGRKNLHTATTAPREFRAADRGGPGTDGTFSAILAAGRRRPRTRAEPPQPLLASLRRPTPRAPTRIARKFRRVEKTVAHYPRAEGSIRCRRAGGEANSWSELP
jgi:hypothetical protein